MSFGFRKGFKSGPFRMTLSKSGVSMSVGAGGARLTAGPRGTRVSFSKGGFYYRTRLDIPQRRNTSSQVPTTPAEAVEFPRPVAPAPSEPPPGIQIVPEAFGDTTSDAVVNEMNSRLKSRNYAIPVGVVISAGPPKKLREKPENRTNT